MSGVRGRADLRDGRRRRVEPLVDVILGTVGPFDAAVVRSDSPSALIEAPACAPRFPDLEPDGAVRRDLHWRGPRVSLALKLQPDAAGRGHPGQIRFTLPGGTPPSRINTAVAAEPGGAAGLHPRRHTLRAGQLARGRGRPVRGPFKEDPSNNWAAAVAKAVDAAGGRGFVH